jgi:hypothetical protein
MEPLDGKAPNLDEQEATSMQSQSPKSQSLQSLQISRSILCTLAALVSLMLPTVVMASPHPATASSTLVAPRLGFYRSPDGFHLHSGDSGWLQTAPPRGNQTILTVYRSPKNESKASLTVRVDRLARGANADRYIGRWIKEYPRFGFDVLGSQPFVQAGVRGHVIDLMNRDSKMQLRQVVFVSEARKRAAILTCRDNTSEFAATLKSCNSIVKTFEW